MTIYIYIYMWLWYHDMSSCLYIDIDTNGIGPSIVSWAPRLHVCKLYESVAEARRSGIHRARRTLSEAMLSEAKVKYVQTKMMNEHEWTV